MDYFRICFLNLFKRRSTEGGTVNYIKLKELETNIILMPADLELPSSEDENTPLTGSSKHGIIKKFFFWIFPFCRNNKK